MIETLKNVVNALNAVEVHGEKNLNYLLASIQTLKDYIAKQEAKQDGR